MAQRLAPALIRGRAIDVARVRGNQVAGVPVGRCDDCDGPVHVLDLSRVGWLVWVTLECRCRETAVVGEPAGFAEVDAAGPPARPAPFEQRALFPAPQARPRPAPRPRVATRQPDSCGWCGAVITVRPRGQTKRYCDHRCRSQANWRRRRERQQAAVA